MLLIHSFFSTVFISIFSLSLGTQVTLFFPGPISQAQDIFSTPTFKHWILFSSMATHTFHSHLNSQFVFNLLSLKLNLTPSYSAPFYSYLLLLDPYKLFPFLYPSPKCAYFNWFDVCNRCWKADHSTVLIIYK